MSINLLTRFVLGISFEDLVKWAVDHDHSHLNAATLDGFMNKTLKEQQYKEMIPIVKKFLSNTRATMKKKEPNKNKRKPRGPLSLSKETLEFISYCRQTMRQLSK